MENVNILQLLGENRTENLLFKVKPELVDKVEDIKIKDHTCDKCEEKTTFAWTYKVKETGEYQSEVILQICPLCKEKTLSKEVTEQLEIKRRELLRDKWFVLPNPSAGFKQYQTYCNSTTKALRIATDYTKKIIEGENQSLVITGSTGTGKTMLSCAIARTLDNKGISVGYITASELFKRLKKTFEMGAAGPVEEKRIFDEFKSFRCLIVDDLGQEAHKIDATGVSWLKNIWVDLINSRQGMSTVYNSNFDDLKLIEIIGERAASRLYDNAQFIDLFLKTDYRKRKMIQ